MVILLHAIFGALLSAWHGGNLPPKTPKVVKNIGWGLLPSYLTYLMSGNYFLVALTLIGNFLKTLGHGQYFSLGKVVRYISKERLDFLVRPFFGVDPRTMTLLDYAFAVSDYGERKLYWRCVFGLFWCGAAAMLGSILALLFINPIGALILFLGSGLSKSIAYMIGWAVSDHNQKPEPTLIGEYLTGLGTYATLALVYYLHTQGVI